MSLLYNLFSFYISKNAKNISLD